MNHLSDICRLLVVTLLISTFSTSYAAITIIRDSTYQTIEGFGFFGGRGCWWDSEKPDYFFSNAWLDLMFDNLGATMWRNEIFPHNPVTGNSGGQDATWSKQKPCAQAIAAYCKDKGFPVKTILTVWSPPKEFKCLLDDDENYLIGEKPENTKGGNVLDPENVGDYRDWLVSALQMYKDAGLDVYALSFQNEPYFWEPYNSCFYYQDRDDHYDYHTYMKTINPGIRNFTNLNGEKVKTFGSEHMLDMEGAEENYRWFYHTPILKDNDALATLDCWAVHGYTDGINSQEPHSAIDCWKRHYEVFGKPTGKPMWQTEISGFEPKRWLYQSGAETPHGGFSLGLSIQIAMLYGKVSAWVWWQGTDSDLGVYGLTGAANLSRGATFYASKQFYRFIRPGAKMVKTSSPDASLVATAFVHEGLRNFVIVICNDADKAVTTDITGAGVPESFEGFVSSAAAGDTCRGIGTVQSANVTIPAYGILTLVNGNYREVPGAVKPMERDYPERQSIGMHRIDHIPGKLVVRGGGIQQYDLFICDMKGSVIKRSPGLRGGRTIDLSGYSTGVYVAALNLQGKISGVMFVVAK